MFTLMDTNNDGKVKYEELRAGLRKVGSQLAEPEIEMLMEVVALQQPPQLAFGCLFFLSEVLAVVHTGWLENIRDWCTSRQRWWGHRISAWYVALEDDESKELGASNDHLVVGTDERAEVSLKFAGKQFQMSQDPDVLDTWFSSGLFPLSVLGWPDDTHDLRTFYPTSVLETGHDILFLHAW
ncbi:Valine--tRNA ligase [Euphorbia peplus]|nr:Valine--tRNA ligase [Euphorbia peplus]